MRGAGTQFGATLDATCDRLTDGALFGAITWWLIYTYHAHPSLIIASFVVLVTSQVISYVKARGEASGFTMVGGLIERPERLIPIAVDIVGESRRTANSRYDNKTISGIPFDTMSQYAVPLA